MRIAREPSGWLLGEILGSPRRTVIRLSQRERDTLRRAARIVDRADELAATLSSDWVDGENLRRADLVLGADAMAELADTGELDVEPR